MSMLSLLDLLSLPNSSTKKLQKARQESQDRLDTAMEGIRKHNQVSWERYKKSQDRFDEAKEASTVVKKPVKVKALRWTGKNHRAMYDFLTDYKHTGDYIKPYGDTFDINHSKVEGGLIIKTLEGEHIATIGDVIIRDVDGEFYPCKYDIFMKTYEILY